MDTRLRRVRVRLGLSYDRTVHISNYNVNNYSNILVSENEFPLLNSRFN